jgi:cyclohexanone monooxygenase
MTAARRIGIIGAGPGGIGAAVELRAAGFTDVSIFEQASGVGGTWWHNRYPGLTCDIKSQLYSFSFAPKADWSRPYSPRDEIQAYMDAVVDEQGLRDHIRFDTRIVRARWHDAHAQWMLTADSGDEFAFDVVVASLGMFNEVNWPEIDGLASFAGTTFHSARWDVDHDLTGERVGVIGSAASAVQFIPEIAEDAGHLTVFQRSANWVLPKEDTPWTAEELDRFRADPAEVARRRAEIFDVVDGSITFSNPEMLDLATQAGLRAISVVHDPATRQALTPTAPYGCQRPLISNTYYPTFNRADVDLVTVPISHVTPAGVVTADGAEHELDTLILATGFKTTSYLAAIDVTGRDGCHITEHWADGAHAHLGITTAGFPNLFMLYGPNTNNGSIIYMLECQARYVVRTLEWMDTGGIDWVDVRPDVEASYNEQLQRDLDTIGVWAADGCHNYYRGSSGRIETQWPHSMSEYRRRTEVPNPDDFITNHD